MESLKPEAALMASLQRIVDTCADVAEEAAKVEEVFKRVEQDVPAELRAKLKELFHLIRIHLA